MTRHLPVALSLLAACALPPAATAAPVGFGPAMNITGDADVRTNGSLVAAYNLGGAAAMVGGVAFAEWTVEAPVSPPAPRLLSTRGAHSMSIAYERDEQTLINFSTGFAAAPFSGLGAGYQALLGTAAGGKFAERSTTLTLGGLTVGQSYEFQAWFNDSALDGGFAFGLRLSDGIDGVDLAPNTLRDGADRLVQGGLGQFTVASFVADATTQVLSYRREEVEGGLAAFQLRAVGPTGTVPTPGTPALVLLGAAAALAAMRRRPMRG